MRFIIIGLGNIGERYKKTRHNVGFETLDLFAKENDIKFNQTDSYYFFEYKGFVNDIILIKPKTYMNNSGIIIPVVKKKYYTDSSLFFIICDNLDLPTGRIKIKKNSGSAGQNGLKSIKHHLDKEYYTIFIGINRPEQKQDIADYVLQKPYFDKEDFGFGIKNAYLILEDLLKTSDIQKILSNLQKYNKNL